MKSVTNVSPNKDHQIKLQVNLYNNIIYTLLTLVYNHIYILVDTSPNNTLNTTRAHISQNISKI